MQLLKTRLENELVLALVVFSLQYILVNHEYWKYKARHIRWKVTLKVYLAFSTLCKMLFGSYFFVDSSRLTNKHVHDLFKQLIHVEETDCKNQNRNNQ